MSSWRMRNVRQMKSAEFASLSNRLHLTTHDLTSEDQPASRRTGYPHHSYDYLTLL